MNKIKCVNAADLLLDTGLLFQINKDILHPLGLAMSVSTNAQTGEKTISQELWDYRLDDEGILYSKDTFEEGLKKLEKFYTEEGLEKLEQRYKKLGFIIQGQDQEEK